jgi:LPXTG-site transpeptidase (sortase) family protein
MKKIAGIAIFLVIIAFGIGVGTGIAHKVNPSPSTNNAQVLHANDSVKNPVNPPTAAPQIVNAVPKTIRIPKINVNASVESVGLDSQKRMDVPRNSDDVAWYDLGYKPGEKGNAVIAGHYDRKDGSPAVFWDLAKLVQGDKIYVTDVNGKELTFEVTSNEKIPYNNFPVNEIFGPSPDAMLNLITCQGTWNSTTGMYSHRTVVFSKLLE